MVELIYCKIKINVQEKEFDVNKENDELIINNAGAMVNFVGTVRGELLSSKNAKLEKTLSQLVLHPQNKSQDPPV